MNNNVYMYVYFDNTLNTTFWYHLWYHAYHVPCTTSIPPWAPLPRHHPPHLVANENIMINEVSACFKTSRVQYGPVDCTQYHLFLPCLPQNSILIVVDAKDRTTKNSV